MSRCGFSWGAAGARRGHGAEHPRFLFVGGEECSERNAVASRKYTQSPNLVSSRKYTWWTFGPLSMLGHFAKYSNCYLLLTALIMLIPDVTPLSPLSAFGPLLFVLLVSEVREFFEEFQAYKRDKLVNSQTVTRLTPPEARPGCSAPREDLELAGAVAAGGAGVAAAIPWAEVRPGDVLQLETDAEIPCDCVLLLGTCRVDTAKLDGESALRKKVPALAGEATGANVPWTQPLDLGSEQPANHPDLYRFSAALGADQTPVGVEQLLLRGTVVREGSVVAVAVYCGKDTKVELNAWQARGGGKFGKATKMDAVIDATVLSLLLVQLAVSVFFAFKRHALIKGGGDEHWYLGEETPGRNWTKAFLTFMILMASLVPASLWVAREVIRVVQAVLIEKDKTLGIGCNSKTLHDDLGNITYLFTDKTGTLTTNQMQLVGLALRTRRGNTNTEKFEIFRNFRPSSVSAQSELFPCILAPQPGLVSSVREAVFNSSASTRLADHALTDAELMFFLNLCFNHTCSADRASSPDEAALVSLVHALGLGFSPEDRKSLGNLTLLRVFEFTPERRMMTVVVADEDSGRVFVLSKGADSALFRVSGNSGEENSARKFLASVVDSLCLEGLRVLALGGRAVTRAFWETELSEISEESEILHAVGGLELLGCVALQDTLQPGVCETLELFRAAGISVSMVTGDKKETAVGVALNCGLLPRDAAIFVASEAGDFRVVGTPPQAEASSHFRFGVVVEGGEILEKLLKEEKKLVAILQSAASAVFCRVTPGEKARLVELMQRVGRERVLAIGDGGNDVSMLLRAHVGVGISASLEGNQAANAADYTVKKFVDLQILLFTHGVSFLKRFTIFNKLFLFKNFILTLCQLMFFQVSGFSGQTVFEDWYLLGFNSVFCLVPLVVAACEASPVASFRTDAAEYRKVRASCFSGKSIFLWFLRGAATSAFLFFASIAALTARPDGTTNDFTFFSTLLYSQLIFLVTALTLTHAKFSWKFLALLLLYNVGMYAIFVFVYDEIIWSTQRWRLKRVALTFFADGHHFWGTCFFTIAALCLAEHAVRVLRRPPVQP